MSSAKDTDPSRLSDASAHPEEEILSHADRLSRLSVEIEQAASNHSSTGLGAALLRAGRGRRRERAGLASLIKAARRWSEELDRLSQSHEEERTVEREESLEQAVAEKESELQALRLTAANRELDLQREHDAASRRQQEEIASLKRRLQEAESTSGTAREEELREVKRLAYERERDLRRSHANKLSEIEREAERRVSSLQAQREADNRSMTQRHAYEKARQEEELDSLRQRRLSEARVYTSRIEELARERAEERTSLEEAVAKLREKHEAERARLQERVESLEEALEEQESITVVLLGELGYVHRPELPQEEAEKPRSELEVARHGSSQAGVQEALQELREIVTPGELLREGLALFNATEHVNVVRAISKSLGEPEVHVALEDHGRVRAPTITLLWPGMGWRCYVSEPRSSTEPQVYLAGQSQDEAQEAPLSPLEPNARLDAQGLLSLGVRPL